MLSLDTSWTGKHAGNVSKVDKEKTFLYVYNLLHWEILAYKINFKFNLLRNINVCLCKIISLQVKLSLNCPMVLGIKFVHRLGACKWFPVIVSVLSLPIEYMQIYTRRPKWTFLQIMLWSTVGNQWYLSQHTYLKPQFTFTYLFAEIITKLLKVRQQCDD